MLTSLCQVGAEKHRHMVVDCAAICDMYGADLRLLTDGLCTFAADPELDISHLPENRW
jgi:hypothetical protein